MVIGPHRPHSAVRIREEPRAGEGRDGVLEERHELVGLSGFGSVAHTPIARWP
jgi:hypothetical protein